MRLDRDKIVEDVLQRMRISTGQSWARGAVLSVVDSVVSAICHAANAEFDRVLAEASTELLERAMVALAERVQARERGELPPEEPVDIADAFARRELETVDQARVRFATTTNTIGYLPGTVGCICTGGFNYECGVHGWPRY